MMQQSHVAQLPRELPLLEDPSSRFTMVEPENRFLALQQIAIGPCFPRQNTLILVRTSALQSQTSDVVQQSGCIAGIGIQMDEAAQPLEHDSCSQIVSPACLQRVGGAPGCEE